MRTKWVSPQRVVGRFLLLHPLLVVLAGAPPHARLNAQEVQLRPLASLYLPSRIAIQHGSLYARQRIGMTIGARLTLTFSQRFDVVTAVTYLPGYVTFRGAGKRIDVGNGSHLLTATTGARYWLLQPTRKLSWEIHTGLGVGFGGQPAYEDLFQSSTVSGMLGATVRYQVGRILSLQLAVHDRLYRVRFGGVVPDVTTSRLRISLGIGLPFLRLSPPASARDL